MRAISVLVTNMSGVMPPGTGTCIDVGPPLKQDLHCGGLIEHHGIHQCRHAAGVRFVRSGTPIEQDGYDVDVTVGGRHDQGSQPRPAPAVRSGPLLCRPGGGPRRYDLRGLPS